ncbi:hypothetical protein [Rhizobium sp. NZLR11]|uniref:hypothetical protein n=1 Tax=Rhizobium sp. NZLR11 TaxID=2731098 RepID=UPI001C839A1D|nr:hypothetical protein [Rhizobium sp. NZLR11]MBX5210479.1 hypothetical protein [Rhizobium sp. NZLR11]
MKTSENPAAPVQGAGIVEPQGGPPLKAVSTAAFLTVENATELIGKWALQTPTRYVFILVRQFLKLSDQKRIIGTNGE